MVPEGGSEWGLVTLRWDREKKVAGGLMGKPFCLIGSCTLNQQLQEQRRGVGETAKEISKFRGQDSQTDTLWSLEGRWLPTAGVNAA